MGPPSGGKGTSLFNPVIFDLGPAGKIKIKSTAFRAGVRLCCATAAMEDGTIHELRVGILFYIPPGPPGHDSWVVGDAPYVSLHFLGADHYANK